MNFIRGVMFGTIIAAGTMMVCSEEIDNNKKKMMRKGKQFVRRIKMSI